MEKIQTILAASGDEFAVQNGLSEELFPQLIALSRDLDPDLQRFTQDAQRFATTTDITQWLQDITRRIYALTPICNPGSLAGIAWLRKDTTIHHPEVIVDEKLYQFQQENAGENTHTVAARLYPEYRGKKLGVPFMTTAHEDYMKNTQQKTACIVADIHAENTASQRLFERLGYQFLGPERDRTLWLKTYT